MRMQRETKGQCERVQMYTLQSTISRHSHALALHDKDIGSHNPIQCFLIERTETCHDCVDSNSTPGYYDDGGRPVGPQGRTPFPQRCVDALIGSTRHILQAQVRGAGEEDKVKSDRPPRWCQWGQEAQRE